MISKHFGHPRTRDSQGRWALIGLGCLVVLGPSLPWPGQAGEILPAQENCVESTLAPFRQAGPGPIAMTTEVGPRSRLAASLANSTSLLASTRPIEPAPAPRLADAEPIARAMRIIAQAQETFTTVKDYVCIFEKRERMADGRLTPQHVLEMKARTDPHSIYFKFQSPTPGREAIFVEGCHGGRVLAHDVGLARLLAGTMKLDPLGTMAMEDCRHPITEAGLGHLIATISERWEVELQPGETQVTITPAVSVGGRSCTRITSTHPQRQPDFLFHCVQVFIDDELGLPIRFEAYDWPRCSGAEPELVEEYTYRDLQINVGLKGLDFDPANQAYAFGRF